MTVTTVTQSPAATDALTPPLREHGLGVLQRILRPTDNSCGLTPRIFLLSAESSDVSPLIIRFAGDSSDVIPLTIPFTGDSDVTQLIARLATDSSGVTQQITRLATDSSGVTQQIIHLATDSSDVTQRIIRLAANSDNVSQQVILLALDGSNMIGWIIRLVHNHNVTQRGLPPAAIHRITLAKTKMAHDRGSINTRDGILMTNTLTRIHRDHHIMISAFTRIPSHAGEVPRETSGGAEITRNNARPRARHREVRDAFFLPIVIIRQLHAPLILISQPSHHINSRGVVSFGVGGSFNFSSCSDDGFNPSPSGGFNCDYSISDSDSSTVHHYASSASWHHNHRCHYDRG
ncbi:hypothetical protein JOB18_018151 [Solea senegalensis]|uniref:Uncharacterized protein n=1 Tax=Solea senegalensis TaxID=28829 RepID=A0AAV6RHA3_SOLSE|nr:hypothetical protein JOB18_018151 [Solea senegalensis]